MRAFKQPSAWIYPSSYRCLTSRDPGRLVCLKYFHWLSAPQVPRTTPWEQPRTWRHQQRRQTRTTQRERRLGVGLWPAPTGTSNSTNPHGCKHLLLRDQGFRYQLSRSVTFKLRAQSVACSVSSIQISETSTTRTSDASSLRPATSAIYPGGLLADIYLNDLQQSELDTQHVQNVDPCSRRKSSCLPSFYTSVLFACTLLSTLACEQATFSSTCHVLTGKYRRLLID